MAIPARLKVPARLRKFILSLIQSYSMVRETTVLVIDLRFDDPPAREIRNSSSVDALTEPTTRVSRCDRASLECPTSSNSRVASRPIFELVNTELKSLIHIDDNASVESIDSQSTRPRWSRQRSNEWRKRLDTLTS